MNRQMRIGILLASAAAIAFIGFYLVQQKSEQLQDVPKFELAPRMVTVAKAKQGRLKATRDYLAVVEPTQQIDIAPRVTGTIETIEVDEGSKVKSGDILMQLNADEIRHRLSALTSKINQARAQYDAQKATRRSLESSANYWKKEKKRDDRLAKKDVIPSSQAEKTADRMAEITGKLQATRNNLKATHHRIASLEEQKKQIQTRREYYTLRSPTDGVVVGRNVDPGDLARTGKTVLSVEGRDSVRLAFDVPQKDLPSISEGLEVIYSVNGDRRSDEITALHPSLNANRMKRAEVSISTDDIQRQLTTGAYVSVSVVTNRKKEATLVPRSSVIERSTGSPYIFAVNGGRLDARSVEISGYEDGRAAITGISPDTVVVRNTYLGWARLASGDKVKAIQ